MFRVGEEQINLLQMLKNNTSASDWGGVKGNKQRFRWVAP